MPPGEFHIPIQIDLAATFLFGLTGALAAVKRGYDVIGLFVLAFVTAVGGGLIRDGLFIQQGQHVQPVYVRGTASQEHAADLGRRLALAALKMADGALKELNWIGLRHCPANTLRRGRLKPPQYTFTSGASPPTRDT